MIRGWHTRGYLPHYDDDSKTQFVTFRLHDSLPENVLIRLKDEARLNAIRGEEDLELQRRIEKFLDAGHGRCYLKLPNIAGLVENKLLSMQPEKLNLKAWVIMPNHAHIMFRPAAGNSMTQIMQSIKGATAREENKILGRTGDFWMRDYFDRYIRDQEHYDKAFRYIENNPVKAGLCGEPSEWRFGSA